MCSGNVKKNSSKITAIELIFCKASRLLASNLTKNVLLHRSFQGFFLDYQKILFPEQLFMGHSWQRVPNIPYAMKTPYIAYPPF